MKQLLKDQVIVITGSTRGLGFAMARALLNAGATVVISGRSGEAVRRAVQALGRYGPAQGKACDVRNERQVYALARWVVNRLGRIDVWINNAGSATAAGRILDTPPTQAREAFLTNDMGTLYGTHAALQFMLPREQGTLVNVYGAGSFLRPATPTALYGATKAWIASFTRSLAKETSGSGVRIVGFSPGMLLTELLTSPTVVGKPGRDMMKNYGFVLRMLGKTPEWAADRLVEILRSNRGEFVEWRGFKPWTPLFGLMRMAWENLTRTGKSPGFRVKVMAPYRPRI